MHILILNQMRYKVSWENRDVHSAEEGTKC